MTFDSVPMSSDLRKGSVGAASSAVSRGTSAEETRFFGISIVPLSDEAGRAMGGSVAFVDVSRAQELQVQLDRSQQDLETAYEELQSTRTMNEELQSSNEELQTINDGLRQRGDDLNRSNGFLESILIGLRSAVVVLDRELHVIAWNPRAEDLWGLRADEVRTQNFLNLDIGLPTEQLRAAIRACLIGDGDHLEQVVPATNRRGRAITCRVTATPLSVRANSDIHGVILLMDEHLPPQVH